MLEININTLIIKIHSVQVSLHLYDKYYHFIAFFAGARVSVEQRDNINIETAAVLYKHRTTPSCYRQINR